MSYIIFNQADKEKFTVRINDHEAIAPVDLNNGMSFIKDSDFKKHKDLFNVDGVSFETREIKKSEKVKEVE